ncbi:MAG: hypothetical protein DRR16_10945 [Candidatus Parabeggiatoa sp. nov. 3]|nr:MAG: hypothetical protein DRR00_16230 [Gammaproteobacteria bacterium]RKZ57823.1 MAG: hypothetical protein DRQ99_26350 [Gammaproteobacteria bacterium]RKZ85914.1 MAG: hypothetical protein DRR16_10945 [Gammaproteobacteria bacterium]
MKTIVSIIEYFYPYARSGDVIAALYEVEQLSNHGYRVVNFYKYIGVLNTDRTNTPEYTAKIFLNSHPAPVNFVISNQPSNYRLGVILAESTGAKHIIRQHINYESLFRAIDYLGIPPDLIITRRPYRETLTHFSEANSSADLVIATDANTILMNSDPNLYFCPPAICSAETKNQSLAGGAERLRSNTCHLPSQENARGDKFHIAISGRLDDPTKGGERIFQALKIVNGETSGFVLNAYGNMPQWLAQKMIKLLGPRFKHYGWIDSRGVYLSAFSNNNVFLTLPYYEAYGLALQEAINLGVIPVSTKQGLALLLSQNVNTQSVFIDTFIDNNHREDYIVAKAASIIMQIFENRNNLADLAKVLQSIVAQLYGNYNDLPGILDRIGAVQ